MYNTVPVIYPNNIAIEAQPTEKCNCCIEQFSTKKGKYWIVFNNCIYVLQIIQMMIFWTIVAYGLKSNKCL